MKCTFACTQCGMTWQALATEEGLAKSGAFVCAHCGKPTGRIQQPEEINHPAHYGGADNVYEAIKVIDAWQLGFSLGNCIKYIARAGKKPGADELKDLRKALFYLSHEIERREKK